MIDRRFGLANKFGTSNTFGASSTSDRLAWGVEVDWDQDGFFDGSNEARRMIGITVSRGRTKFVQSQGKGFEPVKTGKATVKLLNHDGRYDPFNEDSPLYPYVTYGMTVRIKVRDLSGSELPYPVFYGTVTNIEYGGHGKDAFIVMHIEDGWRFLRDYNARVAIQEGIAPDVAIGNILDSIGWQWGRTLGTNSDTIDYWWADGNRIAASEILDITNSFLGYFYIDATGSARYLVRSDVSAGSVLDIEQSEILKDIGTPQPFENNRNITRIKAHPRNTANTGVVWQILGITPTVDAAGSETLWANYTYNNIAVPVSNLIQPVATTDYTMNSQSDGGGSDLTADCTVVVTDFGNTGKVVITNTSGTNAYITKLQIRADAIYEPNSADKTYPVDISSITQPREFVLDLIWQQDLNVVTDFTNLVGPFMARVNQFPIVQYEARPSKQFVPDLFNIVTATITKLGLLGESYRIGGIEHRNLTENCQSILTRFYLEPYISIENQWTWDIADFGTDTVFGA